MKKMMTLVCGLLVLATAVSVAPTATAHECYSLVPGGNGCGACLPVDEEHDHRTVGNVSWCTSEPPEETIRRVLSG